MENALYDFYSLVELYQKTHSFAALTRSFSDTTQSYARIFHGIISIYKHLCKIQVYLFVNHFFFFACAYGFKVIFVLLFSLFV